VFALRIWLTTSGCCCRPWYSLTATSPKDIIIMIDKSNSMMATYLSTTERKLTVAIKASKTAINSFNPNDNVSGESSHRLGGLSRRLFSCNNLKQLF